MARAQPRASILGPAVASLCEGEVHFEAAFGSGGGLGREIAYDWDVVDVVNATSREPDALALAQLQGNLEGNIIRESNGYLTFYTTDSSTNYAAVGGLIAGYAYRLKVRIHYTRYSISL